MFKYDANDTMKLLGKQNIIELGNIEPYFIKEIKDIMTANGIPEEFIGNKMLMMGVNIAQYGAILGKRIERQRNKSKYGLSESQRDYMRTILEIVQNDRQIEESCMSYKSRIALILSAMKNEDYIAKTYSYIRIKYQKEGERRDENEKSNQINEDYRYNIRKMIEQTEDTHALCCTYTMIKTYLRILAEKGGAV